MGLRAFLAVAALAGITAADPASAADDIRRIPKIGFQRVAQLASQGRCARIAAAVADREKMSAAPVESAQAVLAVRQIDPDRFPKREQTYQSF